MDYIKFLIIAFCVMISILAAPFVIAKIIDDLSSDIGLWSYVEK